jgi:predicted Zn-dependent protease
MKRPISYITLTLALALSVAVWGSRTTDCDTPRTYSIGQFDTRFGLSAQEFREAIRHATQLWGDALGREAFRYDPAAPFTINLVFDDRQQATIERQQLSRQLTRTELSHQKLAESYTYWQGEYQERLQNYEDALQTYETRLATYTRAIQHWNDRGEAPPQPYRQLTDEAIHLQQRKKALDAERAELEELFAMLQSMGQESQELAATYNSNATTYNTLSGTGTRFHKGEYDGKAITIYQFHNQRDLTLVMAHELGHALGLKHVDDPTAIMHAFMGEQDVNPLLLTSQDVAALSRTCASR